ncbi:DUF1045 domain-containing protein [Desulfovibrio sp. Fe33]|uniref:DUF1045 domain-containing protein n=1 Tax=Desulfovibrio sp. Fe33 TaxID=3020842 RepID=UPI00234D0BAC|nr:DUF1045 domain-containing protein [Desulfovibrio sp. Fe33]
MSDSTTERYGVYFAPGRGSGLDRFGAAWLGRDNETGRPVDAPLPEGLPSEEWRALTETPRHYGFHGTLMPPFVPADGMNEAEITDRLDKLAGRLAPFVLAPLSVREIGSFLALVPVEQVWLAETAEACLRTMHPLRKPPSATENEKRRASGLTPKQDRLLEEWGYPYVLDEFRFHITLTGRVADPARRKRLAHILTDLAAPVTGRPHPVEELCLFYQPDRSAPFRLIHRAKLGNTKENS